MSQTFKSFRNTTIPAVEAIIEKFVDAEKINPLSIGLTNQPDGSFLAVLGFDKSKYTPVEFRNSQSSGSETDTTFFENHLNQVEQETAASTKELIICHAITYDKDTLNIVMMLAK